MGKSGHPHRGMACQGVVEKNVYMSETLSCEQTPGPRCNFFRNVAQYFPKCIFTRYELWGQIGLGMK